ncbi:hypothetical protein BJF79_29810 [Actinomadura sp. CNU-125]|uniref:TetR/AcrR family transcriptional regulator n=1 Tax=Actinomadura sp. CNU-125 TaxID=1904961 RepID=UPI0009684836|nr:TetR/AcrR family transcriptional regulator [Actinomadura sp. CNU-125]OLT37342.1 hypothetical protein BJF79_29810 [Actinomadura sp. CNU-125]
MPDPEVPTRVRLLEAAVAILAEDGWGAMTSRGVAERAGVNNALVHYYFGSVDALRRAAVLHAIEQELEGPITAIMEAPDVLDGVVAAIARLTAPETTGGENGGPRLRVITEALVHGLRDEELRRTSVEQLALFRGALADRFAAQTRRGRLRADAEGRPRRGDQRTARRAAAARGRRPAPRRRRRRRGPPRTAARHRAARRRIPGRSRAES